VVQLLEAALDAKRPGRESPDCGRFTARATFKNEWGTRVTGLHLRMIDDVETLKLLRSRVDSAGGQVAFAKQSGIDRSHLNRVIKGKKAMGSVILTALNLRIFYQPIERARRSDTHLLSQDDVLKLLRSRVKSLGGQVAFSKQMGVERTYLNTVLNGRKGIGPSIMEALNLRIVYAPAERR